MYFLLFMKGFCVLLSLIQVIYCLTIINQAMQLDDALSAARLSDGRIKVWIHVADPASLVHPWVILDRLY